MIAGISAPYEAPEAPELELETEGQSLEDSVDSVVRFLEGRGILLKTKAP